MEGNLSLLSIVELCFQLYASVDPGLLCRICLSRGKAIRCVPFFLLFLFVYVTYFRHRHYNGRYVVDKSGFCLLCNGTSCRSVSDDGRLKAFYTSSCLGILMSKYLSLPYISFS